MDYLALYRKYRPSNLNEVVGQNEIKKILKLSVEKGTISHAYLFSGPRGTGKTTMAKIFAKMVNCNNIVAGVPCGECDVCRNLFINNDVVEIDAASNNGVDEIRDLREKANLVPSICKYKVYIIDEVHMLTTQAFNALLKTLEEPPKHVIFILATTEYHKVPLTITSRCQKFQFNKLCDDDNVNKLKEIAGSEKIDIFDDALYEIAKLSDGGMRDSINFLDQLRSFKKDKISISDVLEVCGSISSNDICNLFLNLKCNKCEDVVLFLESIGNKGKSYVKFLEDLMVVVRDSILKINGASDDVLIFSKDVVYKIIEKYTLSEIFLLSDEINKLLDRLKYSSRQSVLVVGGFLSYMNKINDSSNEKKEICVDLKEKNTKDDKNVLNSNNTCNLTSNIINEHREKVEKILINKDKIINNCFSVADKNFKVNLQRKWEMVSNYFTDDNYSLAASILCDTKIEVAGEGYILLSGNYDSIVDKLYNNYDECNRFINYLFEDNFNYMIVTLDEWSNLKDEYIKNIKNGVKYNMKDLNVIQNVEKVNDIAYDKKDNSFVDKLFDLVGSDIVEFK